jgi:hypothetical protein
MTWHLTQSIEENCCLLHSRSTNHAFVETNLFHFTCQQMGHPTCKTPWISALYGLNQHSYGIEHHGWGLQFIFRWIWVKISVQILAILTEISCSCSQSNQANSGTVPPIRSSSPSSSLSSSPSPPSSSSSSNGLPFEHLAHEEFRRPQSVFCAIQGARAEISTDVSNFTPQVTIISFHILSSSLFIHHPIIWRLCFVLLTWC